MKFIIYIFFCIPSFLHSQVDLLAEIDVDSTQNDNAIAALEASSLHWVLEEDFQRYCE